MQNRFIIHIRKVLNIFPLLAVLVIFVSFQPPREQTLQLTLKNESQKVKLTGFSVDEVGIDEPTGAMMGTVISDKGLQQPARLKGGTAIAFKNYIFGNTLAEKNTRPIRLQIKKLALSETANANGSVGGELQIQFAFDLITGDSLYTHLVDYKGGIKYTRKINEAGFVEQNIRAGIQNSLKFLGEWLDKHRDTNAALAKSVKVVFSDYTEQPEGDTIYYSVKRPLTWADFQDKLSHEKFVAEVIPGLGFNESNRVKDAQIIIDFALKVYLPKSSAWVKRGEENDINLNHEQRHFDVVKIVSERFKKAISAQTLPVYNYDGYINVAYVDALREIAAMQKQYDGETDHGSNFAQQRRWDEKIDAELRRLRH